MLHANCLYYEGLHTIGLYSRAQKACKKHKLSSHYRKLEIVGINDESHYCTLEYAVHVVQGITVYSVTEIALKRVSSCIFPFQPTLISFSLNN